MLAQRYYDTGLRGRLQCDSLGCTFDVGVEQRGASSQRDRAQIEVLLQGQSRDGLARGVPTSLFAEEIQLFGLPRDRWWWGRVYLPECVGAAVARHCHFRVRPITVGKEP